MSWPTLVPQSITVHPGNKNNYMIQSISLVMQSVRTRSKAELVFLFVIIVIVVMNRWHMFPPFLKNTTAVKRVPHLPGCNMPPSPHFNDRKLAFHKFLVTKIGKNFVSWRKKL